MRSRTRAAAVALAVLIVAAAGGGAPAARADDTDFAGPVPGGWEFDVVPYVWFPETTGEVVVGGVKTPVDVGYDDVGNLAKRLDVLGGMGRFEARHGRWTMMLDAMGGRLQTDRVGRLTTMPIPPGVSTVAKGELVVVETSVAYRVAEWSVPGVPAAGVDVMTGGRYLHLSSGADVTVASGSTGWNESMDWADPFVGGRCEIALRDDLRVWVQGDAGGFGLGSELSWGFVGGVRYGLPFRFGAGHPWLVAGFRMLEFEHLDDRGASDKLRLEGPVVGMGIRF